MVENMRASRRVLELCMRDSLIHGVGRTGPSMDFWNLKTHLQCHTSCNKAIVPVLIVSNRSTPLGSSIQIHEPMGVIIIQISTFLSNDYSEQKK